MQPDFECAHRVGKTGYDKCRDIIARFTWFPERDAVFQERRKLAKNNSRIFINEALSTNTFKLRKYLNKNLKEAKARGQGSLL